MDNGFWIEIQVMHNEIKEMTDAKKVLEKLSEIKKSAMDWFDDKEGLAKLRFGAYRWWLNDNKPKEWGEFLDAQMTLLKAMSSAGEGVPVDFGVLIDTMPKEPPEGWIVPMPYIRGEKGE